MFPLVFIHTRERSTEYLKIKNNNNNNNKNNNKNNKNNNKLLHSGINAITNSNLSETQWIQASLPVKDCLGIRRAASLASSAFLASAASTRVLQDLILNRCSASSDSAVDIIRTLWSSVHTNQPCPQHPASLKQASWDRFSVDIDKARVLSSAVDIQDCARFLASMAPHSGDWLHALPISSCGLRLDDEAVRVAVGLRLGTNLCQPHQCPCGALVDARGTHGLACRPSADRSARHSHINDIIWRALKRAGVPSTKEPSRLSRTDGKRPDGLTLIPWQNGRRLASYGMLPSPTPWLLCTCLTHLSQPVPPLIWLPIERRPSMPV